MTDLDSDSLQANLDKISIRFCAAAEQLMFPKGCSRVLGYEEGFCRGEG